MRPGAFLHYPSKDHLDDAEMNMDCIPDTLGTFHFDKEPCVESIRSAPI